MGRKLVNIDIEMQTDLSPTEIRAWFQEVVQGLAHDRRHNMRPGQLKVRLSEAGLDPADDHPTTWEGTY